MSDREGPILTHVFLRIEHSTVRPEVVSDVLGIIPTTSAVPGQPSKIARGEPCKSNVWVLSSLWAVQSKDVGAHFQWLLNSIGPRTSQLEMLREQGHRMEVHCMWTGTGGYGGPELTPNILRGLASLGVVVYFDVGVIRPQSRTRETGKTPTD